MRLPSLLSFLALATLACTGSDTARNTPNTSATASATPTPMPTPDSIPAATFDTSLGVDLATYTRTEQGYFYKDVTVGTGAEAVPGSVVAVHYLVRLTNGTQVDANQPGKPPLEFQVGAGRMIPGFDYGVRGMKVGGQRMVILPPELAYGPQANGPVPANSILVFKVDLMAASQPGR